MLLYAGYAMRPWAEAHADLLTRYIAAHVETIRWMRRPANRAEVIAALQAELQIPAAEAEASYVEGVGPAGWEPEGRLDRQKLENVARLRRELGGPTEAPIDLGRLIDERYLRRAITLAGAA
jgi:ABC-type nitrate/sulfonate/bicarbonate transport system substrate-binding protein